MVRIIWRILGWGLQIVVSFAQLAVFFAPLVGLVILLDKTTPKHWFPFPVPLLILLWLIMLFVLLRRLWLNWRMRRSQVIQNQPKPPMTRRIRVLYIALIFVIIGATVLAYYAASWRNSAANAADQGLLIDSKQHFNVTLVGNVPQECSDRTQIELERALQKLEKELEPAAPLPTIAVYIFPNAAEFHQETGAPDYATGFSTCRPSGPSIVLPAVECGSAPPTSTPFHEMVHAIVCTDVGLETSATIPRWFNEGLADTQVRQGLSNVLERIYLRGRLWWNRGKIMSQDSLANFDPDNSTAEETNIFYLCSFEFMRYTVSASTADAPWAIISKVRDGESFENAFEDTIGTRWEDLHAKWLRSF